MPQNPGVPECSSAYPNLLTLTIVPGDGLAVVCQSCGSVKGLVYVLEQTMPADRFSRMLSGDEAIGLLDRSPLAVRVFLSMFWGGGSERCGVARAKPGELADDLKSSRRAIVAALQELADAGLIMYSGDEQLAYRPRFALHFRPNVRNNWVAWRNSALAIRDGLIRAQVLEDLGSEPEPSSRPSSTPSSIPSSTPKTLETLETLETKIYIPATRVSDASASAVRPDAIEDDIDELFRNQPVLPKRKVAGEEGATAILARQIATAAVAEWNSQMSAAGNPRCVPDREWLKRNSRNVAKVVAAAGGMENFAMLVRYAANEMPYYAGKPYGPAGQVRAWTMAEWCARAIVEKVQAGLNSHVMRETGRPSQCQLDWTNKPTTEHLVRENA